MGVLLCNLVTGTTGRLARIIPAKTQSTAQQNLYSTAPSDIWMVRLLGFLRPQRMAKGIRGLRID